MGAEWLVPRRKDAGDESIGSFMRRRFGQEAVDYLAEPLLAGIHAGDVDRLSILSLFPRFVSAERTHGSLLRALRTSRASPMSDGAFKSLPGGLSEMVCALVKALGSARIRTGKDVVEIRGSGPFEVRTASGDTLRSRAVVLAAPAHAVGALMRNRDERLAR